MKTTDNSSYYIRTGTKKKDFVFEYVNKKSSDINFIFDVGCNNGDISYPLQKELNKMVYGIDLSKDLNVPKDYEFNVEDIVTSNNVKINDCTLLLSIYHHLLGAYGLEVADDIFLKLLLRTKYLIFDSGNLSEIKRNNTYWYKEQQKYFKYEIDLLNHFNLNYEIIGTWDVAGGTRSVVVFNSSDLENKFKVISNYKRHIGSDKQKFGLVDLSKINEVDEKELYSGTFYHKLLYKNKLFFSKKHIKEDKNKKEMDNLIHIYSLMDKNKLIKFYGYSKKYGFIYEWLDNVEYIGKKRINIGGKKLIDVDVIKVNNKEKYIDFER